jgi:hypothetical protein
MMISQKVFISSLFASSDEDNVATISFDLSIKDQVAISHSLFTQIISSKVIFKLSLKVESVPFRVSDCFNIIPSNFPPSEVKFWKAVCISGNQIFQVSTSFFTSHSVTQNCFASSQIIGIPLQVS